MKVEFVLVDAGCLMCETTKDRWIIEHPLDGYLPTFSKMWDVLIEHPKEPHQKPLKFMGSFRTKSQALKFVDFNISNSINYFNAKRTTNKFYTEDYTIK